MLLFKSDNIEMIIDKRLLLQPSQKVKDFNSKENKKISPQHLSPFISCPPDQHLWRHLVPGPPLRRSSCWALGGFWEITRVLLLIAGKLMIR